MLLHVDLIDQIAELEDLILLDLVGALGDVLVLGHVLYLELPLHVELKRLDQILVRVLGRALHLYLLYLLAFVLLSRGVVALLLLGASKGHELALVLVELLLYLILNIVEVEGMSGLERRVLSNLNADVLLLIQFHDDLDYCLQSRLWHHVL